MKVWALGALAGIAFVALATANSGGYRYGISDQAFYVASVIKKIDPALYPRDTTLIEAQSTLMLSDNAIAWIARTLGVSLPPLYLALYTLTLIALFAAAIAFARAQGFSWWTVALFVLLLTFRHRIAKTGANSLEGYMHPRILAFAFGVAAFACILRGRTWAGMLWTAIAAIAHPTTAVWFGLAVAAALFVSHRSWRGPILIATVFGAGVVAWALVAGPLAGRLVVMDRAWLDVLAVKDYLFPSEWPVYAWLINLACPLVILITYRRRRSLGVTAPGERALVTGLFVLLAVFLVSVPLSAARVAIAVQLQVTRVFWVMDIMAMAYIAWWLTNGPRRSRVTVRAAVLAVVAALSVGRGVFLLTGDNDRAFVRMSLPDTPWMEAMTWIKSQPANWHVLADPAHAYLYGVSVRLAAERDTPLEASKDTALAMYDRDIAMRVADRDAALAGFDHFTAAEMRAADARYEFDVVIVEIAQPLDLPVLHRNSRFVVYDLR